MAAKSEGTERVVCTITGNNAGANAPLSKAVVMECRTPESLKRNPPRRVALPALKVFAAFVAACVVAPAASASGGNYVFQGGTPYQQLQVREALDASSFNWNLVTEQITIDIDPSITRDQSIQGEIFLNPSLLNAGQLAWGVVQNEYAHQVDMFLLTDAQHAIFNSALGGTAWCYADEAGLQLSQYGCERFASTLAWAYWQSPVNCIQPAYVGVVAAGMSPAAFRAFLTSQLGTPTVDAVQTTRQTQSVKKR
jgi:hypothetical protein